MQHFFHARRRAAVHRSRATEGVAPTLGIKRYAVERPFTLTKSPTGSRLARNRSARRRSLLKRLFPRSHHSRRRDA